MHTAVGWVLGCDLSGRDIGMNGVISNDEKESTKSDQRETGMTKKGT